MGTAFLLVGGDWSAPQAGFVLTYAMLGSNGVYDLLEQARSVKS